MAYEAKILADSRAPSGHRLTSLQITLPRIVLAEFNTHRVFSRNSASSRAIPVEKMLKKVQEDPFIPIYWGKNQKGMQAEEELDGPAIEGLKALWLTEAHNAMWTAKEMMGIGVHKQITNRLLEPWLWHTVVVTSSEWENWTGLRRDKNAQPEIRKAADMIEECRANSQPKELGYGQWHLPYVPDLEKLLSENYTMQEIARVSCARAGRVSYETQEGTRDVKKDFEMADRLQGPGHMSPFEHAARPMSLEELQLFERPATKVVNVDGNLFIEVDTDGPPTYYCGNVNGFVQYRKLIPGEAVFTKTQLT